MGMTSNINLPNKTEVILPGDPSYERIEKLRMAATEAMLEVCRVEGGISLTELITAISNLLVGTLAAGGGKEEDLERTLAIIRASFSLAEQSIEKVDVGQQS